MTAKPGSKKEINQSQKNFFEVFSGLGDKGNRKFTGIYPCSRDHTCMVINRPGFQLFGNMATGDQYRDYHHYFPDGFSYSENAKQRFKSHTP